MITFFEISYLYMAPFTAIIVGKVPILGILDSFEISTKIISQEIIILRSDQIHRNPSVNRVVSYILFYIEDTI